MDESSTMANEVQERLSGSSRTVPPRWRSIPKRSPRPDSGGGTTVAFADQIISWLRTDHGLELSVA